MKNLFNEVTKNKLCFILLTQETYQFPSKNQKLNELRSDKKKNSTKLL